MMTVAEPWLPKMSRLRSFDAVGAAGSITSGARLLHLTQPAVTHAIKALELEIGVPLLERSRRGSFLTEAGAILFRRTQRFFRQLGEALSLVIGVPPGSAEISAAVRKLGDVHLRTVVSIWRGGSFKRAAHLLDLDVPTIYRPARDLEVWTGSQLYAHTVDGLALTSPGREMARQFAVAHVEISMAISELAALQNDARSMVRVGVLPLAPKRQLARAVNELAMRNQRARVTIEEGVYPDLVELLRSGSIDFIFGSLQSPSPLLDLIEEAFFLDNFAVVCRRGHPLLTNPSLSLRDFGWVFPRIELRRRSVLDELIGEWKLNGHVQVETNSVTATVAALVTSDRLSLLPQVCIYEFAETIAAVDFFVPQPTRAVGITRRRDWLPTTAQSELIHLLEASKAIASDLLPLSAPAV